MSDFTYKLEGNEIQCTAKFYREGKLVATATSNTKLNTMAVTFNRGAGLKAEHEIFNSSNFLKLSYNAKMLAVLAGDNV